MRANIGCTTKSSAALVSMVAVYRPSTPNTSDGLAAHCGAAISRSPLVVLRHFRE